MTPPSLIPPPRGARIGRQPVDVVERESRVGDGLEAGVNGQRERVDHEPPPDSGAPDASEDGLVLEALSAERDAGGRVAPVPRPGRSGSSLARQLEERQPDVFLLHEPRRNFWPIWTSAGSLPTMLVVRWTRGSSSSATLAMT